MKTLWNLLSFMAIVNLLALAMLGGWLWRSGRVDRDRLQQVRELFTETIADAAAAAEAGDEMSDGSAGTSGMASMASMASTMSPPMAAVAQNRQVTRVDEREMLARQRLRDEQAMLRRQLDAAAASVTERDDTFREQKDAWDRDRAGGERTQSDIQFAKAVKHLESLPPKQGRMIVMQLIEDGEQDQAVRYLDAMAPRPAAKLLREFKTPADARVATELLEELRKLGPPAGAPKDPNHAQRSPDAAASDDRPDAPGPGPASAAAGGAGA